MVLPFHKGDYRKLPAEDEVMSSLRGFRIPPGDYLVPCPGSMKEHNSAGFVDKMTKGPVAMMTVMRSGPPAMGAQLAQWFVYCVVVGIFAAYIAGRALGPGAPYLSGPPLRGRDGVRRLLARALAEHDLVQAQLGLDAEVDRGRADLRAAHRRGVRVALAVGRTVPGIISPTLRTCVSASWSGEVIPDTWTCVRGRD